MNEKRKRFVFLKPKMSDKKPLWTPTETDRITISERLSALLPQDHRPVFTELCKNSVLARFFVQKHMVQLVFWMSRVTGCFNGTVIKPIPLEQAKWFLTLEEAVDLTFAAIWPAFMDMCFKLSEVIPDQMWACEVCKSFFHDKDGAEYHCLEHHPYWSPVKSANKK
jgi:hypothetical protein